jgi:hypothetical protein
LQQQHGQHLFSSSSLRRRRRRRRNQRRSSEWVTGLQYKIHIHLGGMAFVSQ